MPPQRHRRYARIAGITLAVALLTAISTSAATATPLLSSRLVGRATRHRRGHALGRHRTRADPGRVAHPGTVLDVEARLVRHHPDPTRLRRPDGARSQPLLRVVPGDNVHRPRPTAPSSRSKAGRVIRRRPTATITATRSATCSNAQSADGRPARHRSLVAHHVQRRAALVGRHGHRTELHQRRRRLRLPARPHLAAARRHLRRRERPVHDRERGPGRRPAARDCCTPARSTSTATPTARSSGRRSPPDSPLTCARSRSTRPTRCSTRTRSTPTRSRPHRPPSTRLPAQRRLPHGRARLVVESRRPIRGASADGAITGATTTPDGDPVTQTVGINELIQLVNIAGYDNGVYHDLDPAIRALLADDDAAAAAPARRPGDRQLRLRARPADFSAGLYAATSCSDYTQPFPYAEPIPQRAADYRAAVAALPASTFAPFTVHEWVTEPDEEFDACEKWPAPAHPEPPIATSPPLAAPNLPGPRAVRRPRLVDDADRRRARDGRPGSVGTLDSRAQRHPRERDGGSVRLRVRPRPAVHLRARAPADHGRDLRHEHARGAGGRRLSTHPGSGHRRDRREPETRRRRRPCGSRPSARPWSETRNGDGGTRPVRPAPASVAAPTASVAPTTSIRSNSTTRGGRTIRRWTAPRRGTRRPNTVTASVTVTGPSGAVAKIRVSYPEEVSHSIATITGSVGGTSIVATLPAP